MSHRYFQISNFDHVTAVVSMITPPHRQWSQANHYKGGIVDHHPSIGTELPKVTSSIRSRGSRGDKKGKCLYARCDTGIFQGENDNMYRELTWPPHGSGRCALLAHDRESKLQREREGVQMPSLVLSFTPHQRMSPYIRAFSHLFQVPLGLTSRREPIQYVRRMLGERSKLSLARWSPKGA